MALPYLICLVSNYYRLLNLLFIYNRARFLLILFSFRFLRLLLVGKWRWALRGWLL